MYRLLLVLVLVGCARKPKPLNLGTDTIENQDQLRKLEGYQSCLDVAPRIFDMGDAVIQSGADIHPSIDPKKCSEAMDEGRKLPPAMPDLETKGDAYLAALSKMYELTSKPAPRDQVIAAFKQFELAHAALFDIVYNLNHEIHADQLARREKKSGRNLALIGDDLMLRGEDLARTSAGRWDQPEKVDLAAIEAKLKRFQSAFEELQSYSAEHPEEVEADAKAYYLLGNAARAYVIAARQFINRTRERTPYTDAEKLMIASGNERSVPGTPASVLAAYNRLVDENYPLGGK